jgi:hypothetical protein
MDYFGLEFLLDASVTYKLSDKLTNITMDNSASTLKDANSYSDQFWPTVTETRIHQLLELVVDRY